MKTLGGLIALLVLLTACTDDADKKPATPAKPDTLKRDATVVKPAWTADLDAIGQPVVAGDVAVVIAKESGKRLKIVGVNTKTGNQIWSHPTGPNKVVAGYQILPNVTKTASGRDQVVYYDAPKKPGSGPDDLRGGIASVDPATGKIDFTSRSVHGATPIGSCSDGHDVCIQGDTDTGQFTDLRLDLDKKKFIPSTDNVPSNARPIGADGLFSTNSRPGERLGVQREDEQLWSTPLGRMFGPDFTTDNGWEFVHETGPDRYTGLVGHPSVSGKPDDPTYSLDDSAMASFGGKDGKVIWAEKGMEPCFKPTDFDDEGDLDEIAHPVRCAVSGSITHSESGDSTGKDATATIQGYDPETGKTTWSHPLPPDAAKELVEEKNAIVIRDRKKIVAKLKDGPKLIDLANGKTADAGKGTFMCQTANTRFDYVLPWINPEGKRIYKRGGTGLFFPCAADGSAAAKGMTVSALRDGAIKVSDSTYVLSSGNGLVGYTIAKR